MRGNSLNHAAIHTHIPALQSRGVAVEFDYIVVQPGDTVQPVNIPDPNLRAAVENKLRKAPGATITTADMATMTFLIPREANITDLTGLEQATNLRTLWLSDNSISDISPVAGLTNLTDLDLGKNSVSDISAVARLTNLTSLGLFDNSISDISHLAKLTQLTTLSLGDNSISDISPLSGLTNLTRLWLNGNSISDISLVAGLTNLTDLGLHTNSISDISAVARLTNLRKLALRNNNSISDISPVAGLTNLTILVLHTNSISDISPVAGLTNLTHLGLRDNNISNISSLITNTGLGQGDEVDVRKNPLNAAAINTHIPALQNRGVEVLFDAVVTDGVHIPDPNLRAKIEEALRKPSGATITTADMATLTFLDAQTSNITDLTGLETATKLTILWLGKNNISDISPVAGLTNLTHLALAVNSISDISAVAGLTNLTRLGFGKNSISDISAVSGLTNLIWLWLDNNSISDISAVSSLTNLTDLDLAGNSISDISPLVENTGLGSGDEVNVGRNPLNSASINTHIPTLQSRGVEVRFENLKPTTLEYTLSMPAGISLIHVPLKVTEVDGVAKTIESISNLYDALGGASRVNFLITYDTQTQKWHSFSAFRKQVRPPTEL